MNVSVSYSISMFNKGILIFKNMTLMRQFHLTINEGMMKAITLDYQKENRILVLKSYSADYQIA